MKFQDKLNQAVSKNNSLLCVGLDSELEKLPPSVCNSKQSIFEFNRAIIDATIDLVCCYKPNSAFYEAQGPAGVEQLFLTCEYINKQSAGTVPVLLDFKRGDIGNTNNAYARFAFEYLQADAVTLHPYQGLSALKPFFDYKEKGFFILAKTSNPGSDEFQNLQVDGQPLYEFLVKRALSEYNGNHNIGFVAGATYTRELQQIRKLAGNETWLLVPGVGAQSGQLSETMQAGLNSDRRGLIINSSRGIIFASNGANFAETARSEAKKLRDEINQFR